MKEDYPGPNMADMGGRRSGMDRRNLFIPGYKPERRSGQDRREGQDRRTRYDPGAVSDLKRGMDRYIEDVKTCKGMTFALLLSIPIWAIITLMVHKI